VDDVLRWLDKLALQQYKLAFKEASVDGEFLMELREQDLQQVLGMEHRLHVRKIIIQRDKLKPLNQREHQQMTVVVAEEKAEKVSRGLEAPSLDTVFSQARNGRLKRLEESLNAGFEIDTEDEKGNTLLIIASQNRMKRMIELLLTRNANINHQNSQGCTALHYAMVYDTEGEIGEFLISKGADDSIENKDGLSCYDGLGGEGPP
jgi:ankyrin repeat protein